ncbi:hypothetical protein [Burkholderia sp. Bp8963]|uniref:hypothetical protein n=1 Tax=Burkholderia sp. Bp8963 TaxID=2184547 RepID=UPI000F58F432|nr:hypothetical protein [Burkholderia sp. Bp8963]
MDKFAGVVKKEKDGTVWDSFLCLKKREQFVCSGLGFVCDAQFDRSSRPIHSNCPPKRDSHSVFDGLMIPAETVDCTCASPDPIRHPRQAAQPDRIVGSGLFRSATRTREG